ncbi:MAG: hypothetical protein H6983_25270 [Ectothiorhodospiraceae bacterium]|nr:hypothetical protein [Chromatiales bacterium]MCP5157511.1 hypothetical protein [Ectothiorhodospiraceae bacterium]
MIRTSARTAMSVSLAALLAAPAVTRAHSPHDCPPDLADRPTVGGHLEHADIVDGTVSLRRVLAAGEALFVARFNTCDGQGRPATTGAGERRLPDQPSFVRTSAPESNSCAGCHADPRPGGSGDIVANVFVLAQALDPVTFSVAPEHSNERNTPGMFGAGPIELLAREMTRDLQAQAVGLADGEHVLRTKGIEFEVEMQAGRVVASRGVDTDLVVRPFHQSGGVVSLREFTVNALNHHHGMQAEERFDLDPGHDLDPDHDGDGVTRELTVGDVTALTLWQASLGVPGRVLPADPRQRAAARRGERLFSAIGCDGCHRPALHLDDPVFVEPGPYNPPGTFADDTHAVAIDLTRVGEWPRLERSRRGGAVVRAYTDLKRHNLCDPPDMPDAVRHFCNELLDQGRPAQDGRPGAELFLTRKLWDAGSSAPYGHRGDLTTLAEATLAHGGEARATRDAFAALGVEDQRAVMDFLRSLQVLPADRRGHRDDHHAEHAPRHR